MREQISTAANQCNFNRANSLSSALTRQESIFAFIPARLCETGTRQCNFTTPCSCTNDDRNVAWTEQTAGFSQAAWEVDPSDSRQPWWRSGHFLTPLVYFYVLVCDFRIGKALQGWNNDMHFHIVAAWKPTPVFICQKRPREYAPGDSDHTLCWCIRLLI